MNNSSLEVKEKALCKYIAFCPSCGRNITDYEINNYKKCVKCYHENNESQFLKVLTTLNKEIKNFSRFAFEKFNIDLTAIQINWAKKFFLNQSYSIIFPSGTGKTTFGIILSSYLWLEHKKHSYIILPSQQLLEQTAHKLLSIFPDINLLAVRTVSKKKSELLKEQLKRSDFSILITTSMFLNKNNSIMPKKFFDLYFVDDGDLFLKNAKNVNYLLNLMGFSDDDISKTVHLIKLKREWATIKTEDFLKQKDELTVDTKYKGSVIVSSASGIPYSQKIGLFYNLLGFELGKPNIAIRKIVDTYVKLKIEDQESEHSTISSGANGNDTKCKTNNSVNGQITGILLENTRLWIETLGKGGLIFVSSIYGKDLVERLWEYLKNKGINVDIYDKKNAIENFRAGKVDYLLGIASYNNPLTRGIDLPMNICYSVFVGIPKFVFTLKMDDIERSLGFVLSLLRNVFVKMIGYDSSRYDRLLKYIRKGGKKLPDNLQEVCNDILSLLKKEENIQKINESPEAALTIKNGIVKIAVSDITGYLQASGRTSRLSKIGITQGLSLILVDDEKALHHLTKKIRFYIEDFSIEEGKKENLLKLMEQVRSERKALQTAGTGQITFKDSKLIIVESPHKARTIASFFGRPLRRRIGLVEVYETLSETSYICIAATKGHIADLGHDKFYGVEKTGSNFLPLYMPLRKCPKCNRPMTLKMCRKDQVQTIETGAKIIDALRKLAQETDEIFIATDPDAEGEKIAFDLFNVLYPLNQNVKRIEFHEVTKKALFHAIENPRTVNVLAVKSQFLRRISDRWIGFTISNKLQKEFSNLNLSAGRVQTPILGWIIKRYQDYTKNKIHCIGVTWAGMPKPLGIVFKFTDKKQAQEIFNNVSSVIIQKKEEREKEIFPPPPFTTDSLLQTAIKVLKKGAQHIMRIAQELYEFGLITYHRTDSFYISQVGINIAKEYIKNIGKEHLFKYRNYPQGTHEAIRPTKPMDAEELKSDIYLGLQDVPLNNEHIALYDLIFKRFIASQMKEVKVKEITYIATINGAQTTFDMYGEILEEGFNVVTPVNIYKFDKTEYHIGDTDKVDKKMWATSEVELYTQATLIEDMKKKGLGRPSTYSSIIQKLFERGYVFEMRNKIIPLKNGKAIYEYLTNSEKYKIAKYVKPFVSEEYTTQLEKNIDEVENGKDIYRWLLSRLYKDINKIERLEDKNSDEIINNEE